MINKLSFVCKWLLVVCMLVAFFGIEQEPKHAQAFSEQVIQKGATGDDVIELQARLQYIGFYNGPIDGIFSWRTYWAVRNFQYEFGLDVDGLVGQEMKDKLLQVTEYDKNFVKRHLKKGNSPMHYGGMPRNETQVKKGDRNQRQPAKQQAQNQARQQAQNQAGRQNQQQNQAQQQEGNRTAQVQQAVNTPSGFSNNDIQLMANAVYGEARGEPYVGQVAIAAVILNRMESSSFPNDVSGVIFEPRAFTAVADGQIWLTPDETARKAVIDAINGWDPTGGAVYYFNPNTATSGWIWTRPQITQIGKHIFAH